MVIYNLLWVIGTSVASMEFIFQEMVHYDLFLVSTKWGTDSIDLLEMAKYRVTLWVGPFSIFLEQF